MNEIEELFVESLQDLRLRNKYPSKYNILKASGILRLLLLDKYPLINQVNNEYKLKIKFAVRKLHNIDPGPGVLNMEGIEPIEGEDLNNIENLSLDKFVNKRCLICNQYLYSVKDVININANNFGGVHFGRQRSPKENEIVRLKLFGPSLGYHNGTLMDPCLACIFPISNIVINSCKELEEKAKNSKKMFY